MPAKPRADAKLKTLPDALQEELYQRLRRTTQKKVLSWLRADHGMQSSAASLTSFFSWYANGLTLRRAASVSDQLASTIARMPELNITATQARAVADVNFELQALQDRDPKLFSALRKGELAARKLELEREKFEESKKKDWEKGLDALVAEIKGNPCALAHFEAMKASLVRGVSA